MKEHDLKKMGLLTTLIGGAKEINRVILCYPNSVIDFLILVNLTISTLFSLLTLSFLLLVFVFSH